MKSILVFDTSVATQNLGDEIITDAVLQELRELMPDHMVFRSPTHDRIGAQTHRLLREADLSFVGGTNLLSSEINRYRQWLVGYYDIARGLRDVVLLGVGWWQYQRPPNLYTKLFYKRALTSRWMHSVRDSYTENMLKQAGFANVLNTGCPTMWRLTPEHCATVPRTKAERVVLTLTDYKKSPVQDENLIKLLLENYNKVYFWPQGSGDMEYLNTLSNCERITIVPPSLGAFDRLLSDKDIDIDFVGTRLHGGIRAIQHKRRTIVVGVDNRATEKAKDFNFPVVDRASNDRIKELVLDDFETCLSLPIEAIERWKAQFR